MTDPGLVSYIRQADIDIVLRRIPETFRLRLREVFRSSASFGVRCLGSVRRRGRRDINLYSVLPSRVSLGRFIARRLRADEFGAPAQGQWPPWAVRRLLLYDVLLHELGHLQLVNPKTRNWDRRFAAEKLANKFADDWRRRLFAEHFDHPDPVHNAPSRTERSLVPFWQHMNKCQRKKLVHIVLTGLGELPELESIGTLEDSQVEFLRRVCNSASG